MWDPLRIYLGLFTSLYSLNNTGHNNLNLVNSQRYVTYHMSIDSNNQQAICLTYYYSARYLVNDEYFIPDMQQIDSKTGYKARLYYSYSLKYLI